jgi:hypothetical protein
MMLVLGLCAPAGRADTVSSCGWIVHEGACYRFQDLEIPGDYVLPDSLNLAVPGIYHVTGVTYDTPPVCGDYMYTVRLRDVVIGPCIPDTFGCGRIAHYVDDSDCYVWTRIGGSLSILLGALQGFAVGDTALAIGIACNTCVPVPGTCADYGGFVEHLELKACPYRLNPVLQTSWGQVKVMYRR